MGPDPDPYLWLLIRIREAQKHVDPLDPDPEHWLKHNIIKRRYGNIC